MPRQSRLSQPNGNGASAEPAALMSRPSQARRKRKDVQRFTYRIDPDLNEAANAAVEEYADAGHTVTVSQVMDAWIAAGYQAWLDGAVEVVVEQKRELRVSRSLRPVASDTEALSHQPVSKRASQSLATQNRSHSTKRLQNVENDDRGH